MALNTRPRKPMPEARQEVELQQRRPTGFDEQVVFGPYFSVASCRPRLLHPLAGPDQSGFTLVELMVVIAVLAILATIAIPGFQGIVAQNRATSAANELQATLQFARSAAIAQSRQVTVRPTAGGDWGGGWVVETVESPVVVLRESPALRPSVSLDGVAVLRFSSTGTLPGGQAPTEFVLEVESGPGASRTICVTLGGNSKVIRGGETC
jgi:type IV fimbrial biogenesis protein FimT